MQDHYSRVKDLEAVGYYQAPPRPVRGRIVQKGELIIEIVLSGFGYYVLPPQSSRSTVSPRTVRVGAGAILWHVAGGSTLIDPDTSDPYACMVFRYQVKQGTRDVGPLRSQWTNLAECTAFCWETLGEYHRGNNDRSLLGFYVYGRILWEARKGADTRAYNSMPRTVQLMTRAIQDSVEDDWSVSRLGERAGISESHVYTLFRKYLQTSPHDYVLTHRLNKAKQLLITTSLRIKEVGHACGFSDSAHFVRLFRRRIGVTPALYRETYAAP